MKNEPSSHPFHQLGIVAKDVVIDRQIMTEF